MTDKTRFLLHVGGSDFQLQAGRSYIVGSDASCDVRLNHGTVSPRHVLLRVTDEAVLISDLGSRDGTSVDDQFLPQQAEGKVFEHSWQPDEKLQLGVIDLRLADSEAPVVIAPVPTPEPAARSTTAAAGAAATAVADQAKIIDPAAIHVLARHPHEESFNDLVWTELKRAPWFGLSTVIHAIVIIALYLFLPPIEPPLDNKTNLSMSAQEQDDSPDNEQAELPDEEAPEQPEEQLMEEVIEDEPPVEQEELRDETDDTGLDSSEHMLSKVSTTSGDDILKAGKGVLSGGFRKTVSELRESGLEIMFVFDSTGSMDAVLQSTKERISRMVGVLTSLVPGSKIGVITYRDRGNTEDYLTKSVPLSRDLYRSINFIHTILAGGGGDIPEAVDEGLKVAMRQKWSKKSRRMIVLIGDAPPHRKTVSRIRSMAREFARNKRSYIHAIVTSPDGGASMSSETQKSYRDIAKAGGGECLDFDDEEKILQTVLSLAFGRKYKKSLGEVYKLVDGRNKKISTRVRQMVQRGEAAEIRREFARRVVRDEVVRAIIRARRKPVLEILADFLSDRRLPDSGRQASAHILRTVLDWRMPPIDPENPRTIPRGTKRRLLRAISRIN